MRVSARLATSRTRQGTANRRGLLTRCSQALVIDRVEGCRGAQGHGRTLRQYPRMITVLFLGRNEHKMSFDRAH